MILDNNGEMVYANKIYTKDELIALKAEKDARVLELREKCAAKEAELNDLKIESITADEALVWIDEALAEFPADEDTDGTALGFQSAGSI